MITFDPIEALSGLINIVSLSKSEEEAAIYMESILSENGVPYFRDKIIFGLRIRTLRKVNILFY